MLNIFNVRVYGLKIANEATEFSNLSILEDIYSYKIINEYKNPILTAEEYLLKIVEILNNEEFCKKLEAEYNTHYRTLQTLTKKLSSLDGNLDSHRKKNILFRIYRLINKIFFEIENKPNNFNSKLSISNFLIESFDTSNLLEFLKKLLKFSKRELQKNIIKEFSSNYIVENSFYTPKVSYELKLIRGRAPNHSFLIA